MMTTATEKPSASPLAEAETLDDLQKRWGEHRDEMLADGTDPVLVLESFGTVAIASMIAGLGRLRSADVLLRSYAELKRAIVAEEAEPKALRH